MGRNLDLHKHRKAWCLVIENGRGASCLRKHGDVCVVRTTPIAAGADDDPGMDSPFQAL